MNWINKETVIYYNGKKEVLPPLSQSELEILSKIEEERTLVCYKCHNNFVRGMGHNFNQYVCYECKRERIRNNANRSKLINK